MFLRSEATQNLDFDFFSTFRSRLNCEAKTFFSSSSVFFSVCSVHIIVLGVRCVVLMIITSSALYLVYWFLLRFFVSLYPLFAHLPKFALDLESSCVCVLIVC